MRARHGFLELCKNPQAAAEVTLQPVERLGVDAAILFADILLVLEPLGVGLEFTKGDGPHIQRPVRSAADVRAASRGGRGRRGGLRVRDGRRVRKALADRVPLIGFAGAPFTLASYLIEGGASREFLLTKRFMRAEREAWHALLDAARRDHRRLPERPDRGGRPGRAALRLVGGRALARRLPRVRAAAHAARDPRADGPACRSSTSASAPPRSCRSMKEAGGDVIGLDWRVELGPAWERLGHDVAVQGNLDPAVLLSSVRAIRRAAREAILDGAARPARPHLQPRPRRPPGDAGGPREGPRRHRPRAVRAMTFDSVLLIAFGGPERPRTSARFSRSSPRAAASRPSASRRWRTTTS